MMTIVRTTTIDDAATMAKALSVEPAIEHPPTGMANARRRRCYWCGWCGRERAVCRYACTGCAGTTDRRRPTVLSTASRVFSVGLPFGESVRYSDSRLMPASAATAPARRTFRDRTQREQAGRAVVGIVERLHRDAQMGHREFAVGAEFGDFRHGAIPQI